MPPSPFVQQTLQKIRQHYLVVKHLAEGPSGDLYLGLPKPLSREVQDSLDESDPSGLVESLVVIKAAHYADYADEIVKEVRVLQLFDQDCNAMVKLIAVHYWPLPPIFSMEYLRGGTLDDWLEVRNHRTRFPADLAWSVLYSLLDTALIMRGDGQERAPEDRVIQYDMRKANIMIDADTRDPNSNCLPQIKLIDFGRALDARVADYEDDVDNSDLKNIGKVFHSLAHDETIRRNHTPFEFVDLDNDGECRCQLPSDDDPGSRGDFGEYDWEFFRVVRRLSGRRTGELSGEDIREISTYAKRRSQAASNRSGRSAHPFHPADWDLSHRTITGQQILATLQRRRSRS